MPFNTYTFIIFFILILLIYYSLNSWKYQKISLLIASYIFYSAWNPGFVLLLCFSTVCDWLFAKKIENAKTIESKRRFLIASLIVNLGLLGYFKYGEFILDNVTRLLALLGVNFQPLPFDIILPVGISFYTFQSLSYTIDVYRGKIQTEPSLLNYALYVSFFPQLVAGPIVRAENFLPQCNNPRRANQDQFGWGLSLLVIGLFAKVIIADTLLAPVVDQVYDNPSLFGCTATWAAILAFSGQIYCDFSGYSTCAIGAALCFGFILPDNFKAPYAALGFRDFWRRWHISLSSWLRDYLYISLGGNRISIARTSINLMITMLIGGLWHGASWLFVIWGGVHGFYLAVEKKIRNYYDFEHKTTLFTQVLIMILTFLIVSITWIFFRAENLHDVGIISSNLFSHKSHQASIGKETNIVFVTIFLLLIWQIYNRNHSIEHFFTAIPKFLRGVVIFCQLVIIYLFAAGDDRAFIYFQF